METRPLGGSGVDVSRVVLGCGNFGGIGSAPELFGAGETRDQAFELMDAAVQSGVTTFDTADAYGGGRSEQWVGEWLRERGAAVIVETKVFNSETGDPADVGLAPERIRRQVERSLARLGRIDLYLIHEPDPRTPLLDTLRELDALVREGKVGALGASNVDGAFLEEALALSAEHGLARIEFVQNSYSLLDRAAERDVLPLCAEHGLGFEAFSPLAGGWLTGKYRRGAEPPAGSRMTLRPEPYREFEREQVYDAIESLEDAARAHGVDAATLAFAWLYAQPALTAVVVGPRRPEHLAPALRALELQIDAEALAAPF